MRETRQLYIETRSMEEMAASQRTMSVSRRELDQFVSLLSSEKISLLLERDKCCNYVDNYLLATVFIFFKRAAFRDEEYNQEWVLLSFIFFQDFQDIFPKFISPKDVNNILQL